MHMREIEARVMTEQPDFPVNKSEAGTNAYYSHCEAVGYSQGYCVCLAKINAFERDGSLKAYPACEKAISFGASACGAMGMREREREAGKAMFYLDRDALRKACNEVFDAQMPKREKKTVDPVKKLPSPYHKTKDYPPRPFVAPAEQPTKQVQPRAEAPVTPIKKEENVGIPSYADAINVAIKESRDSE